MTSDEELAREFGSPLNFCWGADGETVCCDEKLFYDKLAALLARRALEEAKWWAENPKICASAEDCPECKMKAERIAALEALAGGEGK